MVFWLADADLKRAILSLENILSKTPLRQAQGSENSYFWILYPNSEHVEEWSIENEFFKSKITGSYPLFPCSQKIQNAQKAFIEP